MGFFDIIRNIYGLGSALEEGEACWSGVGDSGFGTDLYGEDTVVGIAACGGDWDGEVGCTLRAGRCDGEFTAVASMGNRLQLYSVYVCGVATGEGVVAVGGVVGDIDDACAVGAQLEICGGGE